MTAPNITNILRDLPINSRYGAPMGACDFIDDIDATLYLQRIKFVDGDYSADGTYWGGYPSPSLRCAFSLGQNGNLANRMFVRARTRNEAKAVIGANQPATQPIKFFK